MPSPGGQFFSDEFGDIEDYFVSDYELIDQYIGDTLWTWGSGSNGALGNATTVDRSTPVTTFAGGTNWKQISSGSIQMAAIKTDGTLWTWGDGLTGGSLGINLSAVNRSTPITTILGGTNWKLVSCGRFTVAATKTDGTLWVWGYNLSGQLGINAAGSAAPRSTPVTTILGGTNWKSVDCGTFSLSAIKTDGTLWSWGSNANGQLGNDSTNDRSIPVTTILGGNNWKSVSVGNINTAAIKTDGTLWVWGLNANGQLGINNTTLRSAPTTTILGGTNWKSVSVGSAHIAAIKTDGTLWLWGRNTEGALGVNDTTDRSTPVTTILGGTNWKQIQCSGFGTVSIIALKTDGTLWVWGNNVSGQLGINATTNRSTPVTTILGRTNWKSVSVGSGNTFLALTAGLNVDFS